MNHKWSKQQKNDNILSPSRTGPKQQRSLDHPKTSISLDTYKFSAINKRFFRRIPPRLHNMIPIHSRVGYRQKLASKRKSSLVAIAYSVTVMKTKTAQLFKSTVVQILRSSHKKILPQLATPIDVASATFYVIKVYLLPKEEITTLQNQSLSLLRRDYYGPKVIQVAEPTNPTMGRYAQW